MVDEHKVEQMLRDKYASQGDSQKELTKIISPTQDPNMNWVLVRNDGAISIISKLAIEDDNQAAISHALQNFILEHSRA